MKKILTENVKMKILIVDDKEENRDSLEALLLSEGYEVHKALSGLSALKFIKETNYDLIITDYKMQSMNGIEFMMKAKTINPKLPFIILTAYASIETSVEAIQKGAHNFLEKDSNLFIKLPLIVKTTLSYYKAIEENIFLKRKFFDKYVYVGTNPKMLEIADQIENCNKFNTTVLITGESGTGKEIIAKWLHFSSDRFDKPFIKINCATLPPTLIESELFGYAKGAFTGAETDKKGLFEQANNGTIFLDEIGELPISSQAKLLRVLQERELTRISSSKVVKLNVRVIAATNQNLAENIAQNKFRTDLYYRLALIQLELPPLRERKEDIPHLIQTFINKYNYEYGLTVKGISEAGLELFKNYSWPGNIRELENKIQKEVILSKTDILNGQSLME
jgi:DNA-binding NtrC family response regulator